MSKLREDYQFVYDTLSLRASMLIAMNSMTGERAQSNIHAGIGTTGSSGKDGFLTNNRQIGEFDTNITTISTSIPLTDSDANKDSMDDIDSNAAIGRNNDTTSVGIVSNRSDSPTLSTRTAAAPAPAPAPAISTVTIARVNTADEEGEVMALLRSLESRRKIQVSCMLFKRKVECDGKER